MRMIRRAVYGLKAAFILPYLLLWRLSSQREIVEADTRRWRDCFLRGEGGNSAAFLRLMIERQEFRTLFYHRIGLPGPFKLFARPLPTLYIVTRDIGPGMVLQHGFATIINATSIGRDCWVNQQVTIGATARGGAPRIGDDVIINAGAQVLGDIRVGDGVRIGANAVVVKDVPAGCTVAGVPARIIRRGDLRVDEAL